MIKVEVAHGPFNPLGDAAEVTRAVELILEREGVVDASISIAIVDDSTIHALNRQFLSHDYATDVLSFLLSEPGETLEGEVVISVDTATRQAARFGWQTKEELLLYLVHGLLHLVGYDDTTAAKREVMRGKERDYLTALGHAPRYGDESVGPGTRMRVENMLQGESQA